MDKSYNPEFKLGQGNVLTLIDRDDSKKDKARMELTEEASLDESGRIAFLSTQVEEAKHVLLGLSEAIFGKCGLHRRYSVRIETTAIRWGRGPRREGKPVRPEPLRATTYRWLWPLG